MIFLKTGIHNGLVKYLLPNLIFVFANVFNLSTIVLIITVSGGSFNPSDSNYVGLGPFSEPETRYVSRYIDTIGTNLAGLLSFRAFGQRLLIPFAHTTDPMYNYRDMVRCNYLL